MSPRHILAEAIYQYLTIGNEKVLATVPANKRHVLEEARHAVKFDRIKVTHPYCRELADEISPKVVAAK